MLILLLSQNMRYFEVRQRFHGFFIDQLAKSESEQGFRLSVLLRTQQSVAEQGRLFMLLFGPVKCIHGEGLL